MIQYKKILMTLALLLTAVGGAWAGGLEGRTFVDFKIEFRTNPYSVITPATGYLPDGVSVTGTSYNGSQHGVQGGTITVPVDGPVKFTIGACYYSKADIVVKKDGELFTTVNNNATCGETTGNYSQYVTYKYNGEAATLTFESADNVYMPYFFAEAVEGSIEVTWDATTKTGTFVMPAFDVEIAPIYAPVAQWAKVENVDQLPTAAVGIYAESNDSIVTPGTVAKIGETENVQGTVMYAVTSTNQAAAPALTAFSATLPTAKDITTAGDVYVWYYIKGVDAPDGTEANAENTFNDSEICTTPLKVTVLNNKFNLTLSPAPVEKVSVTVDGNAATPDKEGKIESVKMNKEVKIKAKEGYKFRKVEVKKAEAAAPAYPMASEATAADYGKVVCAAGHLHDANTAVPSGCTAVGILGKVTETGHGLILALQDATSQDWNTINGWASVTTYAGTTLKLLPDATARGSLTSYTALGSTTVSNWAVAQKSDYDAIFQNLGSTKGDSDGKTYDANVNAYITTGVGGTAISGDYWSATESSDDRAWVFSSYSWYHPLKTESHSVRPVLAF